MIKISVRKKPSKKAEAYERFLEGEAKKNFIKRIAEVLVKSGREKDEQSRTDADSETDDEDR